MIRYRSSWQSRCQRVLVACKILAVGSDPGKSGSMLPNLVIKIVDPSTLDTYRGERLVTEGWEHGSAEIVQ